MKHLLCLILTSCFVVLTYGQVNSKVKEMESQSNRLEQEIIVKCLSIIIYSFPLVTKTQHPSTYQHMLSQSLL